MGGKRQKRKRKRERSKKKIKTKSAVRPLIERIMSSEHLSGREVVFGSPGGVKMSEVILDFAEPLLDMCDDGTSLKMVIEAAILAWNLSSLSLFERRKMIDKVANTLAPQDQESAQEMKNLLKWLVRRKKDYFSEHKRVIVDYELSTSGGRPHLYVVSNI